MLRPLVFVLLVALALGAPILWGQESAQNEAAAAPERREITLAEAINRKVSEVLFYRFEGSRITNAPPTSIRQYELNRILRTQLDATLLKGDIEADIDAMVNVGRYFEYVEPAFFADPIDPEGAVEVEFICREARIAEIAVYALGSGWWRQASPDTLYLINTAMTQDIGDRFSIEDLDRDMRERMLSTGHFIDVSEEHVYRADGVHITFRVVTSQRVDRMVIAGNKRLDETSLKDKAKIKDARYAGPDVIGRAEREIRNAYLGDGYAFAEVTHRVIKIPQDGSEAAIAKAYPKLTADVVDVIEDKADANETVLVFIVHEGPQVLVGEYTFKGIEELVDIPGSDTLSPGKLPFNYWPIWYSTPLSDRLTRVQRALYQVMNNSPGVLSPKPSYNFEAALQDAAFLQDHLRKAGWLDAKVSLEGVTYNEDRSRAGLTYRIVPGTLYLLTAVAVRVVTQPAPTKPEAGPVARVLNDDQVFEAMKIEGTQSAGLETASIGADYRVLVLDDPRSFDDTFFNGDPSDPLEAGALRRVKDAFGEFSYSNIGVVTQPVFLDLSNALANTPEARLLGKGRVAGVVMMVDIDQSQKYRVGEVVIRGNNDTKTSVIRRELRINPGQPFKVGQIERARRNLVRTTWFDASLASGGVSVIPRYREELSDPTQDYYDVDIYVDVIEGSTGSINASAGFSPGAGATVTLSITKKNFDLFDFPGFTGAGQTISFALEPKINETERYTATFTEPFLFGYPVSMSVTGRLQSQEFDLYTRGERGGQISFGHEIVDDVTLLFSYRYFENEINNVAMSAPFIIRREEGLNIFAGPSIEGIYRTLNRSLFPSAGQQQALEFLVASDAFGGDFDMWRVTARSNFAFHIADVDDTREVALSLRAISILQKPFGGTEEIPISQRQFLGSITQTTALRGFKRRVIGPKADRDPIGGNFLVNATAEFSVPLQPGFFWVVGFIDAGELVAEYQQFQGDGFTASAGFGIRILVPLFPQPLGVDFGWPIYDQPGNEKQLVAINLNLQV